MEALIMIGGLLIAAIVVRKLSNNDRINSKRITNLARLLQQQKADLQEHRYEMDQKIELLTTAGKRMAEYALRSSFAIKGLREIIESEIEEETTTHFH